ncbi:BON domain-containing protein [Pseudoalteromonas xiamenensis]|uniref:BON domain-containing protein n=1 Tax=Pseudoalteromonas xiamenensis TaxID=882626 RepID=A0A975DGN9_9GAMM|nr:BON domain-containing protein [Pseudoalteromonas xiamenensis]QTH71387.1 BON domain-containing protein [Pseudoalteromonas xiamenensis]
MNKLIIAGVISTTLMTAPVFAAQNSWEKEANDAWIDGKAEATLLFNGELNNFDINTDVKNGVVTLTGKVENSVEKKLAEELIIGIDGVKDVKNDLTIVKSKNTEKKAMEKNDKGADFTDAKIATVIKTRFLFDGDVDGTDIDVDVVNRKVTLTGTVASEAEKDLAITIAKNASDVTSVDDELEIVSE